MTSPLEDGAMLPPAGWFVSYHAHFIPFIRILTPVGGRGNSGTKFLDTRRNNNIKRNKKRKE